MDGQVKRGLPLWKTLLEKWQGAEILNQSIVVFANTRAATYIEQAKRIIEELRFPTLPNTPFVHKGESR